MTEPSLADWQRAYYQALHLAQFKGGYLARTAHELRSPLSAMMGLQQLILADLCDSPEEERDCVAQSYQAAETLLRLLNQMVQVSKVSLGPPQLTLEPTALRSLLGTVESQVELMAADRNARLTLEKPLDSIWVIADGRCLTQALMILLEGAIAQQSSTVRLGCHQAFEADGNWLVISLEDDRPDPLWAEACQTLAPPPAPNPGLAPPAPLAPGTALWIAQELIEAMGGKLQLETGSTPAGGSPNFPNDTPPPTDSPRFRLQAWLAIAPESLS